MSVAFARRDERPRTALHQSLSSMRPSLAMQNRICKHRLRASAYDLAMHIGATLKKVMKDRGVSPAAMAEHCGVTRGAVSNWFSTGKITTENLVKAAARLQVTVENLMAGELGDRAADPLPPLHEAPLGEDTITLLSIFNQLDGFQRSRVIAFAAEQIPGKLIDTASRSTHKLHEPTSRRLVAIKDEGAISKRPKTSESSEARGRRGQK